MPCTADSADCTFNGITIDPTGPNFDPTGDGMNNHYANMGWVGFVLLDVGNGNETLLRVTTCDVNAKQEVSKPDVIDGRIDPTVYQLGPMIVEGSLSLPLVIDSPAPVNSCPEADNLTTAGAVLTDTWCWATARTDQGRLTYDQAKLQIRYANHVGYTFDTCVVNTYGISVSQGDVVNMDIAIIGRGRIPSGKTDPFDPQDADTVRSSPALDNFLSGDMLAPARVLLWSDVSVTGIGGCSRDGEILFRSNQVREFNFEINNNADRFYTLCGSLFPIDVNVGKREITGSLTLLGIQEQLRMLAQTNQKRFTEKSEVRMAYYIGDDTYTGVQFNSRDWVDTVPPGNPIFERKFVGIVFEIEEISMTNEVLETTVNWHAMGSDQECYQAITPTAAEDFPVWQ